MEFVVGDILKADAECLVNTVNCEGYMGKGIAYQFKMAFPHTNEDYVRWCRAGRLRPGTLHWFKENGKLVVNFPTKDKWRAKSQMTFITDGLKALVTLVNDMRIESIAIPPLGCGNGGLAWVQVKEEIEKALSGVSCRTIVYEPSHGAKFQAAPKKQPRMSASHYLLLLMKESLQKYDPPSKVSLLRLQKACYFANFYAGRRYFDFKPHKLGPYCHAIDILSQELAEFQKYHSVRGEDTIQLAERLLVSDGVKSTVRSMRGPIELGACFANSFKTDRELELFATVCFIAEKKPGIDANGIANEIANWSEEKNAKFPEEKILAAVQAGIRLGVLRRDMLEGVHLQFDSERGQGLLHRASIARGARG